MSTLVVWVLEINEAEPDKRVKTRVGKAAGADPPKLIDLGFPKYLEGMQEEGETRLFSRN